MLLQWILDQGCMRKEAFDNNKHLVSNNGSRDASCQKSQSTSRNEDEKTT